MIVAVHQPNYMPWAGWFAKAARAGVLVLLDDAQLPRGRSWATRTRIAPADMPQWLSLPVLRSPANQSIVDARLVLGPWARKHAETLRQGYPRSVEVRRIAEQIGRGATVADHNTGLIREVLDILGIRTPLVLSSTLRLPATESPSERLAAIVAAVGGDTYLSGMGARAYHDPAPFDRQGIGVAWLRPPADAPEHSIAHVLGTLGVVETRAVIDRFEVTDAG
ncbi:MAG: WbqC family protein [Gemmatimonadales bacterium]|nr:WbqC family protein [Gemmatimonadales bacterium]